MNKINSLLIHENDEGKRKWEKEDSKKQDKVEEGAGGWRKVEPWRKEGEKTQTEGLRVVKIRGSGVK